ncbi:MAG: hypothetical protein EZS28_043187, partial [Streblomastix strix]
MPHKQYQKSSQSPPSPSLADIPDQAISDLIEKLWSHEPDRRPSLVELQEILRDISPQLDEEITQKEVENRGNQSDSERINSNRSNSGSRGRGE